MSKIDTRQRIIDAFIELYATKPLEKITVKQIIESAHLSRCTFYVYFKDVYDLVETIEAELIADITSAFKKVLLPLSSLTVQPVVIAIYQIYQKRGRTLPIILAGQRSSFRNTLSKEVRNILMARLPDLNEERKIALEYAFEYQISAVIGVFSLWASNPRGNTLDEIFHYLKNLTLNGFFKTVGTLTKN